jgi:hypothetical protein
MKPDSKKLVESICHHHMDFFQLWNTGMYLTWRWWLVVAMTVVPWVVWFFIRKRESTHRLLYAGLFVAFLALFLDMLGVIADVWSYPVLLFPILPECSPYNFTILPVVTMVFLQYCPNRNRYLKALVYAALGAFGFQPLMEWAGLYLNDEWRDWYSFPILYLFYLAADWLAGRETFEKLR